MSEATVTTLTYLVPVGPLLAFALILLVTRKSRTLSWIVAWLGVFAALALSWIVAFYTFAQYLTNLHELELHPLVVFSEFIWLPFGVWTPEGCADCLYMGVGVDPLTAIMLFTVGFTVTMIFIYSVGYHNWGKPLGKILGVPNHGQEEPLMARFFAFMSLFAGGMLVLVVANNLLLLFIGWEVMGLCSYLLIGFWYAREYEPDPKNPQKLPPRWASVKAFMTTRVADVVMLLGIVFFYRVFGTLTFSEAFAPESLEHALETAGAVGLGIMTLLIFAGTVGKSAQWPLHVWLPNAMEGPTPVSAVIHAAAMVSAGVYLLLRIFPLIAVGIHDTSFVGPVIAGVGVFTAFMAATMAVAQDDVKGVLAYSTISQLGFMVAAIGMGAYIAAAFHLITHAFFKALLFLGSGSVIHGMEHGAEHIHDHHTDPQDMMNMGGLRKKMPITFWTFLIGGLALSGFPFFSAGFWSKDEIFAEAFAKGVGEGEIVALIVLIGLVAAALLTAFYTMRQISLTFLGKPRTPLAEHAHESNRFMTIPLVLLSIFAVALGWIGIPDNFMQGILPVSEARNIMHHFVGATLYESFHELHLLEAFLKAPEWSWVPLITSLLVATLGLFAGWWIYGRKPLETGQEDPLVRPLGPLYGFLMNKWYWDELYTTVFIRPTVWVSEVLVSQWIDKGVIDGTLHFVARGYYASAGVAARIEVALFHGVDVLKDWTLEFARGLRSIQTGKIQEYALVSTIIGAVLAIMILWIASGGWSG